MGGGWGVGSFFFSNAVIFPVVAAGIAGPFEFLRRVIRCQVPHLSRFSKGGTPWLCPY